MNNRGVSEFIAIVLIIGITLAAFGLIYTFTFPIIKEGIQYQQVCSDAHLYIDTSKGYTCYDSSAQIANVQVNRGTGDVELSGIQFIAFGGGDSGTFSLIEDSPEWGLNKSNLVGYWSFDNLSLNTIFDDSGNANHGIINGAETISGISVSSLIFPPI